jgi:hypothetical protein
VCLWCRGLRGRDNFSSRARAGKLGERSGAHRVLSFRPHPHLLLSFLFFFITHLLVSGYRLWLVLIRSSRHAAYFAPRSGPSACISRSGPVIALHVILDFGIVHYFTLCSAKRKSEKQKKCGVTALSPKKSTHVLFYANQFHI